MNNNEEAGFLIPYERKKLGEFISGLLASPRKAKFRKRYNFQIEIKDIVDIDALIRERVRQHDHAIPSLSIKIYYSDGRSYEYFSIDELKSHAEMKGSRCVRIFLSWVLLVSFSGEEIPARQVVHVEMGTGESENGWGSGFCRYELEYSNVSFREDMANLLERRFERSSYDDKFSKIARSFPVILLLISSGILFTYILTAISFNVIQYYFIESRSFENALEYLKSGTYLRSSVVGVAAFLASCGVSVFLFSSIHDRLTEAPPSTISIGEYSQKYSDEKMRAYKNRWIIPAVGALFAISVGFLQDGISYAASHLLDMIF